MYYVNVESDDVIGGPIKTAQHSIENNSGETKAVFFKLGNRNVRSVSSMMCIAGAKFEEHCIDISRVILDSLFAQYKT